MDSPKAKNGSFKLQPVNKYLKQHATYLYATQLPVLLRQTVACGIDLAKTSTSCFLL